MPQPPAEQKNTALSQAESTTVNTNPAQHTAAEQAVIDEYQASVDNRLLSFIERWKTLKNPNYKKSIQIPIAEITDRAAGDIRLLIGVDVTNYKHMLSGNALEHIEIRHGKNGEADHSLSDPNDIARMGYVLENYDVIEPVLDSQGQQKRSTQYSNADNTMAPLISFKKSVNGTYYVVEAVPDSAAKQLRVVSAYMQKKSRSTDQVLNMAKAPQLTSEVPHGADAPAGTPPVNAEALRITSKNAAIMPGNSILQSGKKYNSNLQLTAETGNMGERSEDGTMKGSPLGGAVSRRLTEGATAAKPTDPAEAAVEQEYRRLVENAITEGDYQRAVELYREYNNPALRAYKEFYTLKTFSEYAASQGYIPATDTALGTEEALASFEERYQKAIENAAKDGIIAAGTPTDHFDRKARFYGLEENLAAVNPNFATKKYEWTHNCQRCVSTLEMRFRGFKVTAKPIPGKAENDDLAHSVELAWKNAVKKWCALPNGKKTGRRLHETMGRRFPGHCWYDFSIRYGTCVFCDANRR